MPASLECPIRGWPLPLVQWYRAGLEVVSGGRVTVHVNGSLGLSPVAREDQGLYYCVGTNSLGSVGTDAVNITVACESILSAVL